MPSLASIAFAAVLSLAPLACSGPPAAATSVEARMEDGGVACAPPPLAPDPSGALRRAREACVFTAGARVEETLGVTPEEQRRIPIRHVVVMMLENRSFDHVLGGLSAIQPDADVADATAFNLDVLGAKVPAFHLATTCLGHDPGHQWGAMHEQVAGGRMSGFVRSAARTTPTDGHFVMGHYEREDLPFWYFLATTFAIADRYFPSVRSGTFPNRDYLLLGTSDGVIATQWTVWPSPALPTIFDELTAAKIAWGVYADDHPLQQTLDGPTSWSARNPWYPVGALLDAFARDTVPGVVFVDGRQNKEDGHPPSNLQEGEAWTKTIYDAAVASPAWGSTALLLTFDEAGGFYDHVPPSDWACAARPQDSAFFELGVRVPLVVASPWARRHYVSHAAKEHTSITRFIEAVFDLPALTARDANSDGLLDMFDFGCTPDEVPDAPAAGAGGCADAGP